jgi:uncharacterized protein (TIGR02757 family)
LPVPPASRLTLREQRLKRELDACLQHYHTPAFIESDPMQFAAPYREDMARCEANALLAALLSYGRREVILTKLAELFYRLEAPSVWDALQAESVAPLEKRLKGFIYRFNTGRDIFLLLQWWHGFYQHTPTHAQALKHLIQQAHPLHSRSDMMPLLTAWLNEWLPPDFLTGGYSYGTRYLVPHPITGGACKRLHMFLRWMCRDDATMQPTPVDFGLWSSIIAPHHLWMPMDTHVARLSREWGLLTRKSTDAKAAQELTNALARFAPEDPVRYDFAFLGYGVDQVRRRLPEHVSVPAE